MDPNCPNCQHTIRPGAKFCPNCGASLQPALSRASAGPGGARGDTRKLSSGPRLQVRQAGMAEYDLALSGSTVSIGRAASGNTVVLPLPGVSRQHARVVPHGQGYAVEDMDSTNGTYLNGKRIASGTPTPLAEGDVIRVGDRSGNSVSLTFLQSSAPAAASRTVDLGGAQLSGIQRFVIGRDPLCNLAINSPLVSWHHAEVQAAAGGHVLNDLSSTNGSFVNGKRVHRTVLKPGDEVQIGPYKLVYNKAGFQQFSSIGNVRLDGVKLIRSVSTKTGDRTILNNVSLTVMPREFIVLVGGSGAGKSTLMDALNGFRRVQSGRVLVNGDDLYQNYEAYRSGLGYVPQSDIIHTGLTVHKALRYTAQLRLPPDTPMDMIEKRIEAVLAQVDMTPQIDQQITSLSGGQRKRVSIASELLPEPSLFFLDEPTSGLDPGLDKKMMFTLNTLADSGRTIVLTTHAINNLLGQCDLVAFLAFGWLVYYGPPDRAVQFFKVQDFADIYSQLETQQDAQQWEGQFRASPDYQQYVAARQQAISRVASAGGQPQRQLWSRESLSNAFRQFTILSQRYLDLILNDWLSLFILLAVMPIIGVFLLLIANARSLVGDSPQEIDRILETQRFYQVVSDAQKLLLMLALSAILLGVFAAAYEIIKERPVYQRERMVNLGIVPYLGSKMAVLFGFGLIQCAALMVVVSFKVDFPGGGVFLPVPVEIYVTLLLAMVVGFSMGLLNSAAVQNSNMVIYLILVVLFVQMIFSGVLFPLPSVVKGISYTTPTRWAMEALGATVDMEHLNGMGRTYIETVGGMTVNETIESPVEFEISYASTSGHLASSWFLQSTFAALFICLTGIVLKKQDIQR